MRVLLVIIMFVAALCNPCSADDATIRNYDVVVVGATPGGIAAALAAARFGHTVALVEYHGHVGAMSSGGLGASDIIKHDAIGGMWDDFVRRVHAYYVEKYGERSEQVAHCQNGYRYEPHVAEAVFNALLAEQSVITVFVRHRLDAVIRSETRVSAAVFTNRDTGERRTLTGTVFIDGTYEGDLAAYAGAEYRLGREDRREFNELFAGVVYMDHTQRTFVAGTTGLGDDRIVAYTYRYCWTDRPENRLIPDQPAGYDRNVYLNYRLDLEHERVSSLTEGFTFNPIPNGKFDINTRCWMLGFPFTEENYAYPEANWDEREKIMEHLRNLSVGLLYFMQNDEAVPEADRKEFQRFGFAKDEFTDNGNFPWQLYVREARRVVGEYILKESDITLAPESKRAPIHRDAISAGEFPIDAFPTRKYEPGHEDALEGYVLMMRRYTMPYHIPYRIIVPKDVDGLLVPVAASATHVAFSSIRVEPTWTAMGHGAGVAAHLAIEKDLPLRDVPVRDMQHILLEQGTVMTYFEDLPKDHPAFVPFNYLGTMGLFRDYKARPDEPLNGEEAAHWLACLARETGGAEADSAGMHGEDVVRAATWKTLLSQVARNPEPTQNGAVRPEVSQPDDTNLTRAAAARMAYEFVSGWEKRNP